MCQIVFNSSPSSDSLSTLLAVAFFKLII
jgi:hypothetical protein